MAEPELTTQPSRIRLLLPRPHRSVGAVMGIVVLAALSVGVAACSDNDEANEVSSPGTDSTSSVTEQPAPTNEPVANGGSSGDATGAPGPTSATLTDPVVVTTDLDAPWSVTFVGTTALVSERDSGRILELDADGNSREVGTVDGVHHGGEGGLLGLAVNEEGVDVPQLFVYSTATTGNQVQRYDLEGTPGSYELGSATTLIDRIPSAQIHNGGRIAIGPDDLLYVSAGDAGEPTNAQDLGSLAGKILRMTFDGDVPTDNPIRDSLIYSYGHRNVQGLAWDDNGRLYASELGQNDWDELNVIIAGGNYGWPIVEGIGSTEPSSEDDVDPDASFINPVQQWPTHVASPSGLAYANGFLVMANLRGTMLRSIPLAAISTSQEWYANEFGRIRDVVVHPSGVLWFVTNNTDGRGTPNRGDDTIYSFSIS